ncbi:MAG: 50S ribosomal protein L11 methyltransferase, partial [Cyclobacteriaceae bacterium]|nr:50S ribosomal protein L11 methyltransferase [Cyclobacteriaceae bacterium HetDA_MAG_MS6]
FEENDRGFSGYIEEDRWDQQAVEEIFDRYLSLGEIQWQTEQIVKKNWNKLWEENYDPVIVEDQLIVRAPFHQVDQSYPQEILLVPKMSFGTGHHATTYLMLSQQLKLNHQGKVVYDLGSGTGVLAIMAHMQGASEVFATDIDDWCIENSQENFELNGIDGIHVTKGDVFSSGLMGPADIILANINKNVLLKEMTAYATMLSEYGHLLLSGFYVNDVLDVLEKAEAHHLQLASQSSKDEWAVLVLQKQAL